MAQVRVSGYKMPMVRFWALAVAVLSTLGVTGRVDGQEATSTSASDPIDDETTAIRVYHVDEFTESAVRRYPSLKAAAADIDAAQARLDEARLSPFFQFEGQARFFVAPGARGTPTFSPDPQIPWSNRWGPGGELGVEGGIPIYTFGKYRSGKKAATAGITAAEYQRELTLNQVVFDVRRAYFGVQLSLDLQAMIAEGKDKLRSAVDKLGARLEADDPEVKQQDYFRLVAALSEIESRESEALRLEATARRALELLSGIEPAVVPECPLEAVQSEVVELGDYVDRALAKRPEVFQLDAARHAQDANLVVKRAGYLPDIILALRATFARTPVITDIENPYVIDRGNFAGAFFGLVARWKLDFAGTNARVKAAKAEIASLKAKTEEAKIGIEIEVNTIYEQLKDAQRRMNSWRRSEKEARKWFVSAGQGYEVGTQDARDFVDAVKAYFSARSNRLLATAEYDLAVAALEKATNVPMVAEKGWRPVDCEE
jgi:outer membrane protein TolC